MKKLLPVIMFLLFIHFCYAEILNGCAVLESNKEYYLATPPSLNDQVSCGEYRPCFCIRNVHNVTFDGMGHFFNTTVENFGIINSSNITLRNFKAASLFFYSAIIDGGSNNIKIENFEIFHPGPFINATNVYFHNGVAHDNNFKLYGDNIVFDEVYDFKITVYADDVLIKNSNVTYITSYTNVPVNNFRVLSSNLEGGYIPKNSYINDSFLYDVTLFSGTYAENIRGHKLRVDGNVTIDGIVADNLIFNNIEYTTVNNAQISYIYSYCTDCHVHGDINQIEIYRGKITIDDTSFQIMFDVTPIIQTHGTLIVEKNNVKFSTEPALVFPQSYILLVNRNIQKIGKEYIKIVDDFQGGLGNVLKYKFYNLYPNREYELYIDGVLNQTFVTDENGDSDYFLIDFHSPRTIEVKAKVEETAGGGGGQTYVYQYPFFQMVMPNVTCAKPGEPCVKDTDCCEGVCFEGKCKVYCGEDFCCPAIVNSPYFVKPCPEGKQCCLHDYPEDEYRGICKDVCCSLEGEPCGDGIHYCCYGLVCKEGKCVRRVVKVVKLPIGLIASLIALAVIILLVKRGRR